MSKFRLLIPFLVIGFTLKAQENPVLQVESYTLDNGFSVFLNQDTTANRVFGAVMVNVGAKHEDPNATGMAHYLEHMLFKGTEKFGTSDFEREKIHLDSINTLYEELAKATDKEARSKIQLAINEQSVKASKYGLLNEFDKMLKSIGGTGINAFTNNEMTFYHNSFPGHELPRWLDLYSERFLDPVFRSFQSELEVVYEEKNRGEDDFERRVYREMEERLFPEYPYGQWDVIGTTEHLKNPSLIRMYQFYEENYVAGNMALILTGNFDPEAAKPLIEKHFGRFPEGKPKDLDLPEMKPFDGEVLAKKRMTPVKAGFLVYKTADYLDEDRIALNVAEYLLANNSETGYINQLMSDNKLIYSGAFQIIYNDAGGLAIFFVPKIFVQSLKKAEKLVQAQLDKVRNGEFSDELLQASKNDLIKEYNRQLENVTDRGIMIGQAFNWEKSWDEFLDYPSQIESVTKEEVIRVASQYFGDNRLKLISRTGFPKKDKLSKPDYKPIVTDQNDESDYYKSFQNISSLPFKPRFIDLDRDVDVKTISGGHQLIAVKNPVHDLFQLTLKFKAGRLSNPRLIEATGLMMQCGAGEYSLTDFKEKLAALGLTYSVSTDQNYTNVILEGRGSGFEEGLKLLNLLVTQPKDIDKAKEIYNNKEFTKRTLSKSSPNQMSRILYDHVVYGDLSFYKNRMSKKELKELDANSLIKDFQNITSSYNADILYSGKLTIDEVASQIESSLNLADDGEEIPMEYLEGIQHPANKITFIHDKKARQSQVWFHVAGETYTPEDYAKLAAFNLYFGGGFSGLVLQEIREYRSLAYSAGGGYTYPLLPNKRARLWGFVGCQADKTTDAIPVMIDLITNLPEKPERITSLQKSLKLKVTTDFPEFRDLPGSVLTMQSRGLTQDPNTTAYDQYDELSMEDIVDFWKRNIKGKPIQIMVYGPRKKIDLDELKKYGEVEELSLKNITKF